MKKFKFTLAKYLAYKRFQEKLRMTELARAMEPLNRHQRNSERYLRERGQIALRQSNKMKRGQADPEELRFYSRYFTQLKRNQDLSALEVEKAQPLVEEEKKKFQAAHGEVRVLEAIREKKYQEYQSREARAHVQELDDLNERRRMSGKYFLNTSPGVK